MGCYFCDYTRKTYPIIRDLAQKSGANLTFLHYPVKEKTDDMNRLSYCAYTQDPQKFWPLNDQLFAASKDDLVNTAFLQKTLTAAGYDAAKVQACMDDSATKEIAKQQMDEVTKTHFYGTPTVFLNNEALVGPKPYRVYAIQLQGLLYWLK